MVFLIWPILKLLHMKAQHIALILKLLHMKAQRT